MKRLITCLLALTLCAGLMCAPAAAAEESAPSRLTPVQVWGTITRLDDDSILLENSNESNPNSEIIVHLSETTYLIDAVTGDPMKAEDLKDGDTVYAWVGPAMALSLPPQAAATIVLGNIPADYAVPQYYQVAEVKPQIAQPINPPQPLTYVEFTATDGTEVKITDKAQLTPYLTKNMVYLESILPGTELLVWKDSQGSVIKAMLFAYDYRGYLSVSEEAVSVNGAVVGKTRAGEDGDVLLPNRAVAEALGMEVSWDAAKGAVVSYGEKMIKPAPLTTNVLFTAMPGGEILGVDGDGETYETYGTCVKENGVTYLSLHTLANLLDLFIAD